MMPPTTAPCIPQIPGGASPIPQAFTSRGARDRGSIIPISQEAKKTVPAPIPQGEEVRIARLQGYEILDTGKDPTLDHLVELAAEICEVPIAMISLVDRERQWFKAAYGIHLKETPREISFCAYAILEPEKIFIVPDTTKDPRFASNPMVTGEPHIRFYAGVPLVDRENIPLGSFCVIDRKPKQLTEHQLMMLKKLSAVAMNVMEYHKSNVRLTHLLHLEKEVYNRLLLSSAELATAAPTFDDALAYIIKHLDPALGWLSARILNMQTGGSTGIHYNPEEPLDEELPLLWQHIDSTSRSSIECGAKTDFVSSGDDHPEYSYMMIPVNIRNRLVALIELIFPDHRQVDPRISEVFDLMASSLATIAERELTQLELVHQATHDSLTGAANRPVILRTIQNALMECDPIDPDSALFFLDMDGFKEVNDNFGHDIGDRLLKEISRRLESVCRSSDMLGRLSGDEFILLSRDIDIKKGLMPLIERIRRSLDLSFMLGELEVRITASIGCVVLNNPDITANELIRRAEEAMYLVKNGEMKGYCIADEKVIHDFQIRRNLDHRVKDGFRDNRYVLHYQPICDLRTNTFSSVEALARLVEKDGRILGAGEFIKSVERTRFMVHLDEWVLTEAIRSFTETAPKSILALENFRLSLNISPAILSTKGFSERCLANLENSGISPTSLSFEIIESNLLPASEQVLHNLDTLRERGVLIALDDFGTGYSNLQQLSKLPVDIIKIDKEFIDGITDGDLTRNAVLGAIAGIAKNLGYLIVAEGVETEGQAAYLKSLGCQYAQGYYFGKPMPMDSLITFINARRDAGSNSAFFTAP